MYNYFDAVEMSSQIDRGEINPTEILEACLRKIRELGELNAFVHVDEEGARAAALASARRASSMTRLSRLDGIPIAVKDNLFVRNMPARWGSRLFADFWPNMDDICVERLRAAGAIVVGKTATPEFSMMSRTMSPISGITRNPVDPSLTPGGSSGGSAAAVAAGIVPLALGTDAGGSIRNPANFTGLIGMRPSTARIPRRFGFPPMALDFQTIGILTRTPRDLSLLYGCLSGPDPRDAASLNLPSRRPLSRPLRIGWFLHVEDIVCDEEVAASVRAAIAAISDIGADMIATEPPYDLTALKHVWSVLTPAGAARILEAKEPGAEKVLTPSIAATVDRGRSITATEYVRALDDLADVRAHASQAWEGFDLFVCPTSPSPAWPCELECPETIGGRPGRPGDQDAFCGWVNALGLPALSLPVTPAADGRPIGLQIVARFGADDMLIDLAAKLESSGALHLRPAGVRRRA